VAAAVSRIDFAPTAAIAEEFRSPGNSTGARRAAPRPPSQKQLAIVREEIRRRFSRDIAAHLQKIRTVFIPSYILVMLAQFCAISLFYG